MKANPKILPSLHQLYPGYFSLANQELNGDR
jgi:hypothetical protein